MCPLTITESKTTHQKPAPLPSCPRDLESRNGKIQAISKAAQQAMLPTESKTQSQRQEATKETRTKEEKGERYGLSE